MEIMTPITPGEWFDKISILMLKVHRLVDCEDRAMALKQLYALMSNDDLKKTHWDELSPLVAELYDTNAELWNTEKEIREHLHHDVKIILLNKVHSGNRRRAKLKQEIDIQMNASFTEVKDYGND